MVPGRGATMGLLDWLFGKQKDKSAKADAAPPPQIPERRTETPRFAPPPVVAVPPRAVVPPPVVAVTKQPGVNAHWIGVGQRVKIHGYEIPDGMLYVGRGLTSATGRVEPALINPDLKVN